MDSEIYKKQEKNALAGSKQQERWCKWCEEWSDLYEEVLDDIVQTEGENKGNEPRKDYFKMQNYFNFDKTTFKLDFGKNANKLNHISNLKIFKDFKDVRAQKKQVIKGLTKNTTIMGVYAHCSQLRSGRRHTQ